MHPHVKGPFHPLKDFELERYLSNDLNQAERARVEALIAGCPEVQAYLETRRAEQRAFRARQPPLRLPEKKGVGESAWLRWRWAFAAGGVGYTF